MTCESLFSRALEKLLELNTFPSYEKPQCIPNYLSDRGFKGTVMNHTSLGVVV